MTPRREKLFSDMSSLSHHNIMSNNNISLTGEMQPLKSIEAYQLTQTVLYGGGCSWYFNEVSQYDRCDTTQKYSSHCYYY